MGTFEIMLAQANYGHLQLTPGIWSELNMENKQYPLAEFFKLLDELEDTIEAAVLMRKMGFQDLRKLETFAAAMRLYAKTHQDDQGLMAVAFSLMTDFLHEARMNTI